ncbi:hypothetical protein CBR_g29477 [Chara braunii]|uniref:non-specific serine/threonine protein kinase n=1 Tax=Chara braunii TaxID=69332 RepID=A0A388LAH8_CHABU|nr:hypothetical protein CBR_g29477 [Chara braunii]|eukprot:GBG79327.1 hypothetical protein CBR_g29477 [Chara braunii]
MGNTSSQETSARRGRPKSGSGPGTGPRTRVKGPGGTPKQPSLTSNVLGKETEDLKTLYEVTRELGRGQFGVTYQCTDKRTGDLYACKTISKRKLRRKEDVEDVIREVQIMHHLIGHKNIVELKGAYEDQAAVHLVMELAQGGELFDRIVARHHYTERAAAEMFRTIVHVVEICHSLGVMHRDLKPENFLLSSKREDADLKATDFGLSVFFKPGQKFTDIVGSAFYVAPEVLARNYGPEADIWSAGVILYILLSGSPPFYAESEKGIFDAIVQGDLDFQSSPWPSISSGAKDLVRRMLTQDPKQRITAAEVTHHRWMRVDGDAPDKPLDSAVLTRLKKFAAANKLKKMALKVIAENMASEEIEGLKEMFRAMDVDGSGTITAAELKTGLAKQGSHLSEKEVSELMSSADVDGNGTIDYTEFIAATMHLNRFLKEEHIINAFYHFDKDRSGYITADELEAVLTENKIGDKSEIKQIVRECDSNRDGKINYEEFLAMMRGTEPQQQRQFV